MQPLSEPVRDPHQRMGPPRSTSEAPTRLRGQSEMGLLNSLSSLKNYNLNYIKDCYH